MGRRDNGDAVLTMTQPTTQRSLLKILKDAWGGHDEVAAKLETAIARKDFHEILGCTMYANTMRWPDLVRRGGRAALEIVPDEAAYAEVQRKYAAEANVTRKPVPAARKSTNKQYLWLVPK